MPCFSFMSVPVKSIYATPSIILRSSGSVGVALLMWLLGALIAAAGTAVYVELGTVRGLHRYDPLHDMLNQVGHATERWREELSRVHVQTTEISYHLHFHILCCDHCQSIIQSYMALFFITSYIGSRGCQQRGIRRMCVVFPPPNSSALL